MKIWRPVIVISALCLLSGCAAYSLTFNGGDLSNSLTKGATPFGKVVVVFQEETKYTIAPFVEALRKSHLFTRVVMAQHVPSANSLAIVEFLDQRPVIPPGFQCFEPYLLVVSLGLIPAYCKIPHHVSFILTRVGTNDDVHIEFSYLEREVLGWVAGFYRISSSWDAKPTTAYANLLRAAIDNKWHDIRSLVRPRRGTIVPNESLNLTAPTLRSGVPSALRAPAAG